MTTDQSPKLMGNDLLEAVMKRHINTAAISGMTDFAKAAALDGEGSGVRFVKLPKTGSITFIVLPPDQQGRIGRFRGNHFNLPEVGGKKFYRCPHVTFPEKGYSCPVCDSLRTLNENGQETGDQNVSVSGLLKVLITSQGVDEKGRQYDPTQPVLLEDSRYSTEWVLETLQDSDFGNMTNPMAAARFRFTRNESGKWDRIVLPNYSPIAGDKETIVSILEKSEAIDLYGDDGVVKLPSADEEGRGVAFRQAILEAGSLPQRESKFNKKGTPSKGVAAPVVKEFASPAQPSVAPPENAASIPARAARPAPAFKVDAEPMPAFKVDAEPISDGKPSCFGDGKVYNDTAKKCLICPESLECELKVNNG